MEPFPSYAYPRLHTATNRGLDLSLADEIMSHLPLPGLDSLRRTSKSWHEAVRDFLRRKYGRLLRKYINNTAAWLSVMRGVGAVISGSESLDFCLHGTTQPAVRAHDLDVYVGSLYALTLVMHLRDVEGYRVIAGGVGGHGRIVDDFYGGVVSVTTLVHQKRKTKIQVVCVAELSASHQVALFWSTLVMTFLTADGYSIAYPSLTLKGIGIVSTISRPGEGKDAAITKYQKRGFTLVPFAWTVASTAQEFRQPAFISTQTDGHDQALVRWNCPHVVRSWGDDGCLSMAFSGGPECSPQWVKPTTSWLMGGTECWGNCNKAGTATVWVRGSVVCHRGM